MNLRQWLDSIEPHFTKGGKYFGKIMRLFRKPSEEQDPKCDKCKGAKKNKKIIIAHSKKAEETVKAEKAALDKSPKASKAFGARTPSTPRRWSSPTNRSPSTSPSNASRSREWIPRTRRW